MAGPFPAPGQQVFLPQQPRKARKSQAFVLPLIVIILGAIGTLLGMLVVLNRPLSLSLLSVGVFSLVAAFGAWFLKWLDRWEPEPPLFIIGAFLWGAGVAAFVSSIVNTIVLQVTQDMSVTAMYSAPLVEESTKAAFLVLVLLTSKRARAEFNSLTDALLYGGMVGLGFSWIENISYALRPETLSEGLQIIAVRLLLVAFLHPMLTMIVSVGIWFGFSSKGLKRILYPFVAWCLAVLLHFLHNGSQAIFGDRGLFVTAGIEVLVFTALIILGVRARHREKETVRAQLPVMVHFGWITADQAGWLSDLGQRKRVLASAGPNRELLDDFTQNTTELAMLRGRLDRDTSGRPPAEWLQVHRELVDLIVTQRGEVAVALGQAQGWTPVQGRPGDNWGTYPYRG